MTNITYTYIKRHKPHRIHLYSSEMTEEQPERVMVTEITETMREEKFDGSDIRHREAYLEYVERLNWAQYKKAKTLPSAVFIGVMVALLLGSALFVLVAEAI